MSANQPGIALDEIRSAFIAVDLHIESTVDPAPLVRAFGDRVSVQSGRIGRKHWLHLILLRWRRNSNPSNGILDLAELVEDLPVSARRIWKRSKREFDIGLQGGLEPPSGGWILEPRAVKAAADCGAQVRITVYSPRLLVGGEGSWRTPD